MNIPLTTAVLILLSGAMLLVRIFWDRIHSRLKLSIVSASIALVLIQVFFAASKWGTTSDRLNVFINWLAVAAYEILVLLFTRLSPRWLTYFSATILLIPVFGASIMLPLAELFDPSSYKTVPIGGNLFYEVKPWGNPGSGNKGADLIVSYHPPIAPFLRHKVRVIPFNDRECNSNAAIAIPFPATKTVLGRCPRWPSESEGTVDKLFPLS
ncbi:hypothetical protein [Tunturiibacter gelidoferens]|uniref:Uncharacterized protein n=1 Tax=Tunturiibacter lichenicola TaxID=2051959 RepID=A0A7Y9NMR5_9BACT|nr:hypothetical protein [Edaphobacter lichenicola]NYF51665.1 hypothetical protein [Edaphobacter lichenicola]